MVLGSCITDTPDVLKCVGFCGVVLGVCVLIWGSSL